jgi:hypothetical protein
MDGLPAPIFGTLAEFLWQQARQLHKLRGRTPRGGDGVRRVLLVEEDKHFLRAAPLGRTGRAGSAAAGEPATATEKAFHDAFAAVWRRVPCHDRRLLVRF